MYQIAASHIYVYICLLYEERDMLTVKGQKRRNSCNESGTIISKLAILGENDASCNGVSVKINNLVAKLVREMHYYFYCMEI